MTRGCFCGEGDTVLPSRGAQRVVQVEGLLPQHLQPPARHLWHRQQRLPALPHRRPVRPCPNIPVNASVQLVCLRKPAVSGFLLRMEKVGRVLFCNSIVDLPRVCKKSSQATCCMTVFNASCTNVFNIAYGNSGRQGHAITLK